MEEGGNDKQFSLGDSIKAGWKMLPKTVKLYILAGIGGLVVIIIIASAVLGLVPSNFLNFSDGVQESNEYKEEYEEYWNEFCEDEDSNCSEEQIEAAKKLKESQEKFYKKLDTLAKNNGLTAEQKYIVLTTIFYNYDIDDFSEGTLAFEIDDNDEIDYEPKPNEKNVYERETDSLKELIKQFKVNTAYCEYTYTLSSGEESEKTTDALRDADNKPFIFNFFDNVSFFFGFDPANEGFTEAKEECLRRNNSRVFMEVSSDSQVSIEGYYKYLKESTYLDDRPQNSVMYANYAKAHSLSSNISSWPEEDKIVVRERIIKDIQDIVEEYVNSKGLKFIAKNGTAYWWPIGSLEATPDENGVLFAADEPSDTRINSPYGYRYHPQTGKYHLHNGVDLNGAMNTTYIIASLGGTVTKIVNECASQNSNGCGGGYGNHIEILDVKGNINIYAHIYKDSFQVQEGDTVSQGQVLAKVGSSGNSTGPHLHFVIKVNGAAVDPMEYIDAANPRPSSMSSVNFNQSSYSREEFAAKLKEYYSQDGICNSSSSQHVNGCTSFKNEVINRNGAYTIYDTATRKNLNPELVVGRSVLEGYSPGTSYNYFGYRCYNTGGVAACQKFTSFSSAMETFFNNISQYDSIESMMSRYSYLGDYWYTGVHWGWGGCAYAQYIYPDGVPERVATACAKPDGTCTTAGEAACVPTTQEDKDAYTAWQVYKYADVLQKIFG